MLSDLSFLTLLCLVGAAQGVLLAAAVGSLRQGLVRSNRFLAAIFLGSATVVILILLSHRTPDSGPADQTRLYLEVAEYSLWLFAGPLLFLYVSLAVKKDEWPPAIFALHFAPALLWLVWVSIASATMIELRFPPVAWMMLHQMTYTFAALYGWKRFVASGPGADHKADLGIHASVIPALFIVLIIQHAAQLVRWAFPQETATEDIVPLAGATSFALLTLFGLRRTLPLLGVSRKRYASSTLTPERAATLSEQFTALMETQRPYLKTDLTLDAVAEALGCPKTHLSQVLNETFGESFLEILARYRVDASVQLLTDPDTTHLTIDAIARRSGFKSRSAFYTAFRRHHGGTPAQLRRQTESD